METLLQAETFLGIFSAGLLLEAVRSHFRSLQNEKAVKDLYDKVGELEEDHKTLLLLLIYCGLKGVKAA